MFVEIIKKERLLDFWFLGGVEIGVWPSNNNYKTCWRSKSTTTAQFGG
jgi:hypothetical protein